ncbi:MMS19 nucleotide excision repair protein homolog [Corticium candelabrum]|uniref:MMS19 nucleotide excision repair protein homolog n=1 Tax=Corticium candelabrum TaxID=121492 RepID=UPI002E272D36|nr:MMS19 nucleotide excision repair protein homolog [Corticium candelabrum]
MQKLLLDFYCDRLKDRHVVIPHVLAGLCSLVLHHSLPDGAVRKICSAIYKEVHTQGLSQGDRRHFYNIAATLLENPVYQEELKTFSQDFVFGFIQAMDGERDPRNLVLAFQCVRAIAQKLPFEMFAEDLFEVVACYFPVEFTPPPDDPHGITRDDLVSSLRQCLSASNKLSKFCLPLLLEKMASNVRTAKLDSLETLVACAQTYNAEDFSLFSEELWRAIRQEVFQPGFADVEESAISALQIITRNMASGLVTHSGSSNALDKFLQIILKECIEHLKEPSLRLIKPSGRVLQAIAAAADPTCVAVLSAAMPVLLSKYTETMQAVHQRNLLEIVLSLLKATMKFSDSLDVTSPLMPFKESLMTLFYTTLNHTDGSVCCVGLSGLAALLSQPQLLMQEEELAITHHITQLLLEDVQDIVKSEALNALSVVGRKSPLVVQKETLPILLNHDSNSAGNTVNTLTCLSAVSVHVDIVQVTVPEILARVDLCSQSDENQQQLTSIAVCAFTSLASIVQAHIHDVEIIGYIEQHLLPHLIAKPVYEATQECPAKWNIYDKLETLAAVCSCIRNVMLALDASSQDRVVQCVSDLFVNGKSTRANVWFNYNPVQRFEPLKANSTFHQTQLVSLLMAVVCHCSKDIHFEDEPTLLRQLVSLACTSTHQPTCTAAAKCLAGLINKMEDEEELRVYVDLVSENLFSWSSSDENCFTAIQLKELTVLLWLCKALVMRSHDLAKPMVDKLISLFSSQLGEAAADGFCIILSDCPDVMSNTTVCNSRLMFRQKFFIETVPILVDGFNRAQGSKSPFVKALSYVLQSVPKQVLLAELQLVMPLLIQSLSLPELSLKTSTLSTLCSLVRDAPLIISQHLTSLMPSLLSLAQQPQQMKVRISALQCLGLMTVLPHHLVFPFRLKVIRALAATLDDKKRLVRKEAVKCRGEWFLLGSAKQ